jgi:hypothetical protein
VFFGILGIPSIFVGLGILAGTDRAIGNEQPTSLSRASAQARSEDSALASSA